MCVFVRAGSDPGIPSLLATTKHPRPSQNKPQTNRTQTMRKRFQGAELLTTCLVLPKTPMFKSFHLKF